MQRKAANTILQKSTVTTKVPKEASSGDDDANELTTATNGMEGSATDALEGAVDKLRMALEDMTAVCILEGFQKQDHLVLVDAVLKELGEIMIF